MDKDIICLLIWLSVISLFTIIILIKNVIKNKKNNKQKEIEFVNFSFKDIITELDYLIDIYIKDFIFNKTLSDSNVFFSNKLLIEKSEKISNEIINDISINFEKKILIYITKEAVIKYVTKSVLQKLLAYANDINKIS